MAGSVLFWAPPASPPPRMRPALTGRAPSHTHCHESLWFVQNRFRITHTRTWGPLRHRGGAPALPLLTLVSGERILIFNSHTCLLIKILAR